jgi:PAS domain S-box-containing protein
MTGKDDRPDAAAAELRRRAEGIAQVKAAQSPENREALLPEKARQTLHELRVHQIELAMQNEELRRAQVELEASRARYFDFYDLAPVGFFTISEKGLILEANLTAATMLGVARDALVKQSISRFIFKKDQNSYYLHRKQLFETGEPQACDLRMRRRDGTQFWAHLTATAAQDAGGAPVSRVVLSDITERKQAEEALRDSEARFRTAFENAAIGLSLVTSDGTYLETNSAMANMIGYDRSELIGKPVADFTHPDDVDRRDQFVRDLWEGNISSGEQERRFVHRNGSVVHTLIWASVQRGESGKPLYFISLVQDITKHKQTEAENKKIESQLLHAQKMEAIGTLAGGIAHDFNNILSVIIGNTEILNFGEDIDPSVRNGLDQILAASQRAKQLVSQILAISRNGKQEKILINLKPIVKETLEFLRASLPALIQLRHHLEPDAGTIMAEPSQMQQVLMNLCVNAGHAMGKDGGVLQIDLSNAALTQEDTRFDPKVEPGDFVKLTVSDTGHGMEPSVLQRIFDPYFTTKELGKGTGLGLTAVHGIVTSHGGMIRVDSEVGKGTTFTIFLPRAMGFEKVEDKPRQPLPMGTEKILFVDDEKVLADLGRQILGELGYQVETRTSPVEALEAFRANPQKFDLMITDLTMPQMTGLNLASKIMEIRPGMPIILCTGFSEQANEQAASAMGICAFLLKPLVMRDMAGAVRKALDECNAKSSI